MIDIVLSALCIKWCPISNKDSICNLKFTKWSDESSNQGKHKLKVLWW